MEGIKEARSLLGLLAAPGRTPVSAVTPEAPAGAERGVFQARK